MIDTCSESTTSSTNGWPLAMTADTAQMAYGYVRTGARQPASAHACGDLLTWWSVAIGLRLATVFRDRGVASMALARTGCAVRILADELSEVIS